MYFSPPIVTPQRKDENANDWIKRNIHIDYERDFPVNKVDTWHGGVHISHTDFNDVVNPVRAIADGEVIFFRSPSEQYGAEPLCYQRETYDGVVFLRHTLILGEQKVSIVFYSLYMHLKEVSNEVLQANGKLIKKGTPLGASGKVDGRDEFHFQICCDEDNLKKIVGRNVGDVDVSRPGRKDIVYGDTHYYLPPNTSFMASPDKNKQNLSPLFISDSALYIIVTSDKVVTRQERSAGSGIFNSIDPQGIPLNSFPERGYGETVNYNKDDWVCANFPGGRGWVNITLPGINRYSDADFPHWAGWQLVGDDLTPDSQCNSATIAEWKATLNRKTLQDSYCYAICRFPFEWDENTIDRRFNWLKKKNDYTPVPMNDASWKLFEKHIQTLGFYNLLPADIQSVFAGQIWHFHPVSFICHLNKASQDEYIAVVGSQYDNTVANKLSFVGQAVRYLRKYQEQSGSNLSTLLIFNREYSPKQLELIEKSAKTYNFEIKCIKSCDDLFTYLNEGQNRNNLPVKQLSIFSHGLPGNLAFGYELDDASKMSVNLNNFKQINADIFSSQGRIDSYACRTGMGRLDGHSDVEFDPQPENSLAQKMANYFSIPVGAYIVRSSYEDTWGSQGDRINNKISEDADFQILANERNESVKFCGASYNISGALHDVKAGNSPYNLPSEYVEFTPNE